MLENIEALRVFYKHGNMQKAALELRVSQSAISKRLGKLQDLLGFRLFTKSGRHIHLTARAIEFLLRAEGPSAELAALLGDFKSFEVQEKFNLKLGVSESLLASFAAPWVVGVCEKLNIYIIASAHRGTLIAEKVQSGELVAGICAGYLKNSLGLFQEDLGQEVMCFVGQSEMLKLSWAEMPLIGIEEHSMSWSNLKKEIAELGMKSKWSLGSYTSILNLAIAGMGVALVPMSLADAYRIPADQRRRPKKNIFRSVSLIYRKSALNHLQFMNFRDELLRQKPRLLLNQ